MIISTYECECCAVQAPFCVHPKTGKVCVPIDPEAAWDFDPDNVPTVQQLVQELAEQQQQLDALAAQVEKEKTYQQEVRTNSYLPWHVSHLIECIRRSP